ncbi:MAG TPA: hypothetical protein VHB93_01525 [Candidatus Paceibacterota bacterium]|nr:hypothetical protein [Candidatus Paceibacterota bacterium]
MPPENESALERLRARLYKPQSDLGQGVTRSTLRPGAAYVPRGWEAPPEQGPIIVERRQKLPLAVRFLISAGIFFVLAGAIAAYFLYFGGNSVSTNNIRVAVTPDGSSAVASGDTLSLLVTIENHNPVTISNTRMTVDFPAGTRSADDVTQAYTEDTEDLGDLPAGQAVTKTVRAVLFGSENQQITIPVKVEYKTPNSNAVFVKETDYNLTLTTSPVSVTATSVSQITPGQQFSISLLVRSNAPKPLTDIALSATYPFGFTVASTSLPSSNGLFTIGTLKPGQEQKITVTGTLNGADTDTRVFHWNVGSTASSTNGTLAVTYGTAESDIAIEQPFLNISLSLNGSTASAPTVTAGEQVQGTLSWSNTLGVPVLNGKIVIAFSGGGFDPSSVRTQNGFYQSSNGTITYDSTNSDGLRSLAPGGTGSGTFTFTVKSADQLAQLHSPSVTLNVSAQGTRVDETGVSGVLTSTVTDVIKIASGLGLSSSIVHTVGPFSNSGAWPPVPGSPTTYTVLLAAHNGVNATAGNVVTMTLPTYVTFTGLTNPADGSITYNDTTRTVKWVVGDLASGASDQAAFQISFLPSNTQENTSPVLVGDQTLSGTDRFTQTGVSASAGALTTQAPNDPAYTQGDGTVR